MAKKKPSAARPAWEAQLRDRAERDVYAAIDLASHRLGGLPSPERREKPADLARIERVVRADPGCLGRPTEFGEALTPLHYAAGLALPRVVERLARLGADVNAGAGTETPLHAAFGEWDENLKTGEEPIIDQIGRVLQLLLRLGADPRLTDARGRTPFVRAMENSSYHRLAPLLAFPGMVGDLNVAVHEGQHDAVRDILAADPNAVRTSREPERLLIDAIGRLGRDDPVAQVEATVRLLLDHGADPNRYGAGGVSPLFWAAGNSPTTPKIVQLLLDHGADVNYTHCYFNEHLSVLDQATAAGSEALVRVLRKAGAKPLGELQAASGEPRLRLLGLLRSLSSESWGRRVQEPDAAVAQVARVIRKDPAAVHGVGEARETPLHLAAEYRFPRIVAALGKAGADPGALDVSLRTPLFRLLEEMGRDRLIARPGTARDLRTVRALVAHGADVNFRRETFQDDILSVAVRTGHPEVVAYLLDAGAARSRIFEPLPGGNRRKREGDVLFQMLDLITYFHRPSAGLVDREPAVALRLVRRVVEEFPAAVSARGALRETPLHAAARRDLPLICEMLLDAGADPAARDRDGMTPLERARASSARDAARALARWGRPAE